MAQKCPKCGTVIKDKGWFKKHIKFCRLHCNCCNPPKVFKNNKERNIHEQGKVAFNISHNKQRPYSVDKIKT